MSAIICDAEQKPTQRKPLWKAYDACLKMEEAFASADALADDVYKALPAAAEAFIATGTLISGKPFVREHMRPLFEAWAKGFEMVGGVTQ